MPFLGHMTRRDQPPTPGEKYRRYLADRNRIFGIHGTMSNNVARAFNSIQPLGNPNAGRSGFGGGGNSPGGGGDGVGGAINNPGFTALATNRPPVMPGTNLIDWVRNAGGGGSLTPSGLPPSPGGAGPPTAPNVASRPATSSSNSVRGSSQDLLLFSGGGRSVARNGGNRGFSGNSVFK